MLSVSVRLLFLYLRFSSSLSGNTSGLLTFPLSFSSGSTVGFLKSCGFFKFRKKGKLCPNAPSHGSLDQWVEWRNTERWIKQANNKQILWRKTTLSWLKLRNSITWFQVLHPSHSDHKKPKNKDKMSESQKLPCLTLDLMSGSAMIWRMSLTGIGERTSSLPSQPSWHSLCSFSASSRESVCKFQRLPRIKVTFMNERECVERASRGEHQTSPSLQALCERWGTRGSVSFTPAERRGRRQW